VTGPAQGSPPLPAPGTEAGRAGLAALLDSPGQALLAFDFDGTLAPIVDDPDAARAHRGAAAPLRVLARVAGTLAVITGRPAAVAAEYAGLQDVPGVIVLGQYGRQRWQAGTLQTQPPPPGLADARRELPLLLDSSGAAEGTRIEDKGDALAVHTRQAADPAAAIDRLRAPLAGLARQTGLAVEPGRFVLELRPAGSDKGLALRALAAERAAGAILFCGDDLGDLAAFQAVAELRSQGIPGIKVCSGSAEVSALAQDADLVVDGPAGVVALLRALAAAFAPAG
jgi:trehalose 6-phosphate phosphatase